MAAAACVAYRIGWLLMVLAAAMALPVAMALIDRRPEQAAGFLIGMFVAVFCGGGLVVALRGRRDMAQGWVAITVIGLAWLVVPLFAALPLRVAGPFLTLPDAYFQAVSALTTTGASLMPDDLTSWRPILLWLAVLQWLGGLGVLAVASTVFAALLWAGVPLLRVPMPSTERTLINRLPAMTRMILPTYTVVTAAAFMGLLVCEVPLFSAVCFALSAVSTGGLAPVSGGIAIYPSAMAPVVLSLATIAGGTSIMVHWYLVRRRFRDFVDDIELRFYLAGLLGAVLLTLVVCAYAAGPTAAPLSLSEAAFLGVSLLTTTGWTMNDMAPDAAVPLGLLLGLPTMGAMAFSTAGGIKFVRVVLLFKQAERDLIRLSHPNGVARVIFAGRVIEEPVLARTGAVFLAILLAAGGLTLAVSAQGVDFEHATAASLSVLSNTGPAFDLAVRGEQTYGGLPESARHLLCIGMILGRLEVLALLSLINTAYWRQ